MEPVNLLFYRCVVFCFAFISGSSYFLLSVDDLLWCTLVVPYSISTRTPGSPNTRGYVTQGEGKCETHDYCPPRRRARCTRKYYRSIPTCKYFFHMWETLVIVSFFVSLFSFPTYLLFNLYLILCKIFFRISTPTF